jgi:hypothetical protein
LSLCRAGGRIEKDEITFGLASFHVYLVQIGYERYVYFVDYRRTVLNPRTVSHAPYFPCFDWEVLNLRTESRALTASAFDWKSSR